MTLIKQKNRKKIFVAYGNTKPLTTLGYFSSNITIGSNTAEVTFYMIKHGTNDLLGKQTVEALVVLNISINAKTKLAKFKNVLVDMSVDKTRCAAIYENSYSVGR